MNNVTPFDSDSKPLSATEKVNLPHIIINSGLQLRDIAEQARNNLILRNSPPTYFLQGNTIIRVLLRNGRLIQERATTEILLGRFMRTSNWFRIKNGNLAGDKPPKEVAYDMQANPDSRLPQLRCISNVPILTITGEILFVQGFDPESGIFYAPPNDLILHPVSTIPSTEEISHALSFLTGDVLGDFHFASHADRANAIGTFISPFV